MRFALAQVELFHIDCIQKLNAKILPCLGLHQSFQITWAIILYSFRILITLWIIINDILPINVDDNNLEFRPKHLAEKQQILDARPLFFRNQREKYFIFKYGRNGDK